MTDKTQKLSDELKRIRSILSAITGFEDDDQEYVEDARKSVDRIIEGLAEQPAQQEPVAWAVYWGHTFAQKHSVYSSQETANMAASEIKSFPTEVRPLYTSPQPAQQETVAFVTPLMEQQMFVAWCPYRGNPDPRVVWAAAVASVNGLLLGATPKAQPKENT